MTEYDSHTVKELKDWFIRILKGINFHLGSILGTRDEITTEQAARKVALPFYWGGGE